MTRREQWAKTAAPLLERALVLVYPRRCPLCGRMLGTPLLCENCAPQAAKLEHKPPRLPPTEHALIALTGAASAYYYSGAVRGAILLCKQHGRPWYARELADLVAVRVFGAAPPQAPGRRPGYQNASGIPLYSAIVPVPPRNGGAAPSLPLLLARRLGAVLDIPVCKALYTTRTMRPQKQLNRQQRMQNTHGAYAAVPGADLTGQRILLVDDIITTGATVSACAQALLQAGAFEVFAVSIAADEERQGGTHTPPPRSPVPQGDKT